MPLALMRMIGDSIVITNRDTEDVIIVQITNIVDGHNTFFPTAKVRVSVNSPDKLPDGGPKYAISRLDATREEREKLLDLYGHKRAESKAKSKEFHDDGSQD